MTKPPFILPFLDDPDDPAPEVLGARFYRRPPGQGKITEQDIAWLEETIAVDYRPHDGGFELPRHLATADLSLMSHENPYDTVVTSNVFIIDDMVDEALRLREIYFASLNAMEDWQAYAAAKRPAHDWVKSVAESLAKRGKERRDDEWVLPDPEGRQLTEERIWEAIRGTDGEGEATSYDDSYLKSDWQATESARKEAEKPVRQACDDYLNHICSPEFQKTLVDQFEDDDNIVPLTAFLLSGLEQSDRGRAELDIQLGFVDGEQGEGFAKAVDKAIGMGKIVFEAKKAGRHLARLVALGLDQLHHDAAVALLAGRGFKQLKEKKFKTLWDLIFEKKSIGDLITDEAKELHARFFEPGSALGAEMAEYLESAEGKYQQARDATEDEGLGIRMLAFDGIAFIVAAFMYVDDWKKASDRDRIIGGVNLAKDLAGLTEMVLRFWETNRKVTAYRMLADGVESVEEEALRRSGALRVGRAATVLGAIVAIVAIVVEVYKVVDELFKKGTEWENIFFSAVSILSSVLALVGALVGAALGAALSIVGVIIAAITYVLELYFLDHPLVDWMETTPWGTGSDRDDAHNIEKLNDTVDSYYRTIYGKIRVGFDEASGRLWLSSRAFETQRFKLELKIDTRTLKIEPNPEWTRDESWPHNTSPLPRFLLEGKPNRDIALLAGTDGLDSKLWIVEPWEKWEIKTDGEHSIHAGLDLDADRTPDLIGEVELELERNSTLEVEGLPAADMEAPTSDASGLHLKAVTTMSFYYELSAEMRIEGTPVAQVGRRVESRQRKPGTTTYRTSLDLPYEASFWRLLRSRPGDLNGEVDVSLKVSSNGPEKKRTTHTFTIHKR